MIRNQAHNEFKQDLSTFKEVLDDNSDWSADAATDAAQVAFEVVRMSAVTKLEYKICLSQFSDSGSVADAVNTVSQAINKYHKYRSFVLSAVNPSILMFKDQILKKTTKVCKESRKAD